MREIRGGVLRSTGNRLEDYPFADIVDVTLSFIVDEGGSDPRARNAMRQWAMTGTIEGDSSEPGDAQLPAANRRTNKIGEGVYVSDAEIANFEAMGGVMERQPSRRQREQMEALTAEVNSTQPSDNVSVG